VVKNYGFFILVNFLQNIKIEFLSNSYLFAQEEKKEVPVYGWKNAVLTSLNLTQSNFDNWSAVGENSISWQLNLNANFTLHSDSLLI